MSEVQVVATIPVKVESIEQVKGALADLVTSVRTEDGCIRYDAFESASTPGTFVTVEVWASQEALDAHMTSPTLGEAVTALADHFAGDIAIHPLRSID